MFFLTYFFSSCSLEKKDQVVSTCVDSEEAICTSSNTCSERVLITENKTIEVFRNQSLTGVHCGISHAVILIHGRDLNPGDYFSYGITAAISAGRLSDTLVLSPYFREQTDQGISTDLYWDRNAGSAANFDWAMGGESFARSSISSYTVVDEIIKTITTSGRFPNLTSIVLAGHSAGGQFIQRYALSGNLNNQGATQKFYYVVANPSSYAYLNDKRPITGSVTTFEVPDSSGCASYDRWGYGLLNPNSYVGQQTSLLLISQYVDRKVTYLLGDADTNSSGMDITCYANFQGTNRFERGTAFFNFMNEYYIGHQHTRLTVPGVGHSANDMFNSSQGLSALFPIADP